MNASQQTLADFFVQIFALVAVDALETQETFGLVGRDFLFGTGKAFFEQLGPFSKNGCQKGGRRVFGEHGRTARP